MRRCSNAHPRWCVERAILRYRLRGDQAAWMRRIPGCESTWNALAFFPGQVARSAAQRRAAIAGDRSSGLFAFKPSTWRGLRYRHESLFEAKYSALAAALMVTLGRTGEWSCR